MENGLQPLNRARDVMLSEGEYWVFRKVGCYRDSMLANGKVFLSSGKTSSQILPCEFNQAEMSSFLKKVEGLDPLFLGDPDPSK